MIKKVKISVALLLIVFLSTITTAYAWLTLANVNRIQNISLSAIGSYDLLISLDGENYYEEIPKELILDKLRELKFNDVTSMDGFNFYNHYDYKTKSKKNKDYLSLEIYFKTTSRYTELHLTDNLIGVDYDSPPQEGTYIVSKGKSFTADVKFLYSENEYVEYGETRKYFAQEAMRVSIHNYLEGTTKTFDLSGNAERGFGKSYGAIDYYQKTNQTTLNPPEAPETIYEFSTFSEERPIALTDSSYLITLIDQGNKDIKGNVWYQGQIQMNIWLEGWDADAFDAIRADQLKMQFMFRAVMPKHEI